MILEKKYKYHNKRIKKSIKYSSSNVEWGIYK